MIPLDILLEEYIERSKLKEKNEKTPSWVCIPPSTTICLEQNFFI